MNPKTSAISGLMLILLFAIPQIVSADIIDQNNPRIRVSFDQCISFIGSSSTDYSEFTGEETNFPECSTLELAYPGHVYRTNDQIHSCTPGLANSNAMCVDANNGCFYDAGNIKALRFNVRVIPNSIGIGSIEKISFYEQAPEEYMFTFGETGPNDYPTMLGLRILRNGQEIYRLTDIETSRTWTLREFDLRTINEMTVTEESVFSFELLGYCPIGNGAEKMIWDIEELVIEGDCNNTFGGIISTDDPTSICQTDNVSTTVEFDLTGEIGTSSTWILLDGNNNILSINSNGSYDFGILPNGMYTAYHLTHDATLGGLELGNNLANLTGCYDLSNGVEITNSRLELGLFRTEDRFTDAYICSNVETENIISTVLEDAVAMQTDYLITSEDDIIIETGNSADINFVNFPAGAYRVYAVVHNGNLLNAIPGSSLSELQGCFLTSNSIRVRKEFLQIGSISIDGVTQIDLCGSESMMVTPEVSGAAALNATWLITDAQGQILDKVLTAPFDITQYNTLELRVYLVSFIGRLDNFDVGDNVADLSGCFLLSNFITINNDAISGGTIDSAGEDAIFICLNNQSIDSITVSLQDNQGDNSDWLVTDANGDILAISDSNVFDFSQVDEGICLIWHLSSLDGLQGLFVGNNASQLEGCFALSNVITVTRQDVLAGEISVTDSTSDTLEVCSGDGIMDRISVELINENAPFTTLVVTDSLGNILEVPTGLNLDFEGVEEGTCLIYNVAAESAQPLQGTNLNVNQLDGCVALSNAITVIRNEIQAGVITTIDSSDCVTFVSIDSNPDSLVVNLSGNIGDNGNFVITDQALNILDIPSGSPFKFENIQADTFLLWHISYNEGTTGLFVGNNASTISGCFALSSSIKVIRESINGGVLATTSIQDQASICLGDNEADTLRLVLSRNEGPNFQYVVTSDQDTILELSDDPLFTFENAPEGVCYIYHLAYTNGLQGLASGNALSDLAGTFDLSNRVTVTRSTVTEGMISGPNNQTEFSICSGDGIPDSLMLSVTGNMGTNAQWVVTDTAHTILELLDEAPADFEGVGEGTCYIYHVSHLPGINGLRVGSDLDNLSGCFGLSNRVTIERSFVDGGQLSLSNGATRDTIIVGDQLADSLDFNLTDAVGDTMLWVLTDTAGVILQLPTTAPPYDFNDFDPGVCLVWNLSVNGDLENAVVGNNASQLSGCFDLSNPVTLVKEVIDGGIITSAGSLDICLSDLQLDTLNFTLESAFGSNSAWVITDGDSLILELPMAPPFDFGGADPGICLVWHLSYEDNLMGLAAGNSIADLSGSFDLSNSLTVNRESVTGGTITLDSGSQDTMLMVGVGMNDTLNVLVSGVNGADTSSFIITDTLGEIIALQETGPFTFENAGGGVCEIWFLPYLDGLTGLAVGNNVSDLDGCYALSAEPVTVIREGLMGGNLLTSDGLDEVAFCVGDGEDDLVNVMLSDTMGPIQSWVITDTLGLILELPMAPPFNFETTPVGVCQIWNVSHTSSLTGLTQGENVSGLMGNFDLSNPITVFRSAAEGGSIETNSNPPATEVTITLGDNTPELIGVTLMGATGENTEYIITDTLGNILELGATAPFNFEFGDPGVCDIWHLSYGNGLQGLEVDNNVSQLVGCFDLSNSIRVTREELVLNGGMISTTDATTQCAGDGIPDPIDITLVGASGVSFNYFLTDTLDVIQALLPAMPSTINLEQANDGIFRVRHIAYAPGISGFEVGNSISDIMGSFALSNFITITNNGVDGGDLNLLSGSQDTSIMVGDGMDDFINVNLTGEFADSLFWLITDPSGEIVALPMAPPFNLEGAVAGVCQIWNLSTNGAVTGLALGNNVSQLSGCFDLSTPVTVTRIGLNGGTIANPEGSDTTNVCFAEMMVPDSVEIILTNPVGPNRDWIIATSEDTILLLPNTGPPFDFSTAGLGTCYVYHIAYENGLMGLQGGESINDLSGMFNLSNRFVVLRNEANGGMIMTSENTVLDSITVNDGMPDTINIVQNGTLLGDQNMFVVTDNQNNIVALQDTSQFIFETEPGGTCKIWSLSYNNELTGLSVGNNIADLNGCFDLSNEVTVVKDGINGGNLSLTDGTTEISICSNDGISDAFDVMLTDTSATNHVYILTTSTGIILDDELFAPFDFESLMGGATELYVYNLAYENDLMGLMFNANIANMTGTFDLSNPVIITRDFNQAGLIFSNNNLQIIEIVVGEGVIDTVQANIQGTPIGDTTAWVIQNTSGQFIDLPDGPPFFFENSNSDSCFISLVAFSDGMTGLELGNTVDSLEGCYNFSNQITVVKKQILGGVLALNNGMDSISFCVGDGIDDTFGVTLNGNLGDELSYIVADSQGVMLQILDTPDFNFEGFGEGECRVYAISYSGTPNGLFVNQNISNIIGCYALSNPIVVTRIAVLGGMVGLSGGGAEASICLNDNLSDVLSFTTTSNSPQYLYVITDSEDVIDTILTGATFDFANSAVGTCKVYGVSLTGDFIAMPGDTITTDVLSSECADLSGNVITVTKEDCPGIPVINEISSGGLIEIKNIGPDTIDVTGYRLCVLAQYAALGNLTLNCGGSLMLPPDSLITVELDANLASVFDPADGEMGLYIPTGGFGIPQNIVDYVEWGSTGHTRSGVAVMAGIWTTGDFVSAFAQPNSLNYDGDGDASSDWNIGPSNLCATNFDDPQDDIDVLSYKMYPNPASERLIIDFERIQEEAIQFYLFDSDGKVIIRRTVSDASMIDIDLINLKPGVYYSRLTKGYRMKTDKVIIIE